MDIFLNILNDSPLNLNTCSKFLSYYNNPNSFSKHIIDLEINNGHYNNERFKSIFSNKDAVMIDGGANIGLFSVYLNKSCKKIYAIEPTPEHAEVIKEFCSAFDIKNIETHELAFNNFNGFCSFTVDETNTTTNHIHHTGPLIRCMPILDFIKSTGEKEITLLKLDIEGGERASVLEDPSFEEASSLCKNIYMELHPPTVDPNDVVNKLVSCGFNIEIMNSEYLNNNLNILAFK